MLSAGKNGSLIARWLPLSIIVIITLTASINRSLVGLIMQPVKSDFGLTDTQVGALFSMVGVAVALCSPLLGHMVDRLDRHRVMIGAIFVWSLATAAFRLGCQPCFLGIGRNHNGSGMQFANRGPISW
jgi:predicted MFS family arabinose efflux permease